MTREEAITLLQSRANLIKKDYPDIENYAEALLMTIEALNHSADDSKKVSSSCGQENDLISRRAAVDAILGRTTYKTKHDLMSRINTSIADENGWLGGIAESLDEIEDLPSAQPEQRWILCSERLPEEDGLYLVTTSKGQVQVHVFSHNGNSEEYWMRCNMAWMPLPEPYTERREEP